LGFWTSIITTGLIKHIVAGVGNMAEGIINVDHKAIVEVYFGVTVRRSATSIRSQIASQLGTPLIDKRRHIISFNRV